MKKSIRDEEKWCRIYVAVLGCILCIISIFTIVIDPMWHFHKPFNGWVYPLSAERYNNDGIIRNTVYDAMISGTSMTQNFKVSECERLFHVKCIKVPLSGGTYREVDGQIRRACKRNPNLRLVIRSIDYYGLMFDKDLYEYEEIPTYLYDDNPFNDGQYLFNWEILKKHTLKTIQMTMKREAVKTFDEYGSWMQYYTDRDWGKDAIIRVYERPEQSMKNYKFGKEELKAVEGNIIQNVVETAKANPDVKFYYFFSPHNMFFWDSLVRKGTLESQLGAEKYAIELMLECSNIYLFSFNDDFDLVCDFDKFKDPIHYNAEINTWILTQMKEGKHRLLKSNYKDYYKRVYDFYMNYDYSSLFEEDGVDEIYKYE